MIDGVDNDLNAAFEWPVRLGYVACDMCAKAEQIDEYQELSPHLFYNESHVNNISHVSLRPIYEIIFLLFF